MLATVAQGLDETLLAKFLACLVEGLGCAVGVEEEGVASVKFAHFECALPFLKQSITVEVDSSRSMLPSRCRRSPGG